MGLDGHTHLHDAPAQDNDAQGLDDGKDEVAHIVYDSQRVACGSHCGAGQSAAEHKRQNAGRIEAAGASGPLVDAGIPLFGLFHVVGTSSMISMSSRSSTGMLKSGST